MKLPLIFFCLLVAFPQQTLGSCPSGQYTDPSNPPNCLPCSTSGNGANAATVTCTSGTDQVATTCNAGYGLVTDACGACAANTYAVQGNSAECQTCASGSYTDTGTGTTGSTCSTCATSGKGANAATVTCTSGTDQVATTCDAGYGLNTDDETCLICTQQYFSTQGNTGCEQCPTGSYTDSGTGNGGTTCTPCATTGKTEFAATYSCTDGTNQIAITCNAG
jgi:hypothetical protein